MDDLGRRALIKSAAIGTLAFIVDGASIMLTPQDARAHRACRYGP